MGEQSSGEGPNHEQSNVRSGAELRELQQSLATVSDQLRDIAVRVEQVLGDGETFARPHAESPVEAPAEPIAAPVTEAVKEPAAAAGPATTAEPLDTKEPITTPTPVAPAPVPPAGQVWPAAPAPGPAAPPPPPSVRPSPPPPEWLNWPDRVNLPESEYKSADNEPGSWADNTGSKVLGWVGGGVTVLGIVLLLVIASQQDLIGPAIRVVIGLAIGLVLLLAGVILHARPHWAVLAVMLACTGLAVEYLTVIGAVRLTELVIPIVGFTASAAIVAVAVWISVAWRHPWLAGIAFAATGLLAPVVGDGLTDSVLIFEIIMVLGGAVCLLLNVGQYAWIGAAGAAAVVLCAGLVDYDVSPTRLLLTIAFVVLAWAVMVGRWVTGRALADPGPFPLRPRPSDPEQVARDYAEYHAHQRLQSAAYLDRATASASLAVSAALLVLTMAVVDPPTPRDVSLTIISSVLAVLFVALAWVGQVQPVLRPTILAVTAWSTGLALAALALMNVFGGDATGLAWVITAALALAVVGASRSIRLLVPTAIGAFITLIAANWVIHFGDLLGWPPGSLAKGTEPGLDGGSGMLERAWTTVLPTGVVVVVVAAAAAWAVSRCVRLRADHDGASGDAASSRLAPDGPLLASAASRRTLLGWWLVGCAVAACYGAFAVVMVVAYLISFTQDGYQGGQMAMTALLALIGLALLWQGFRQVILRIGGLVFAALAVAKLLLFDTASLEAIPRAMTFIGIGLLLLLAAALYVRTMSRLSPADGPASGPANGPANGPVAGTPPESANTTR